MPRARTFEKWEAQHRRPERQVTEACPCGARDVEHERWCVEYRRLGANGAWRIFDARNRALR